MLHSLVARRWFGPQTQWRPLHKALTSGLGLDDLSLAWPAVVQLVVSFLWLAVDFGLAKSSFLCFIIVINLILTCTSSLWCIDWVSEPLRELNCLCIMNYIGTKGGVCRQLKYFETDGSFAIDRSKAVVPLLFLILCSFVVYTTGRLMF